MPARTKIPKHFGEAFAVTASASGHNLIWLRAADGDVRAVKVKPNTESEERHDIEVALVVDRGLMA